MSRRGVRRQVRGSSDFLPYPHSGAQPTRNPPRTAPSSATTFPCVGSNIFTPSLDSDPTELKSRLGSFLSTPSPAPNGNLARNAENVGNSGHFRNFSLSTPANPLLREIGALLPPPTADKNRAIIQGQGSGTMCKGKIWSRSR